MLVTLFFRQKYLVTGNKIKIIEFDQITLQLTLYTIFAISILNPNKICHRIKSPIQRFKFEGFFLNYTEGNILAIVTKFIINVRQIIIFGDDFNFCRNHY